MLKKRNIHWIITATLLVAVTDGVGIGADQLGLLVTASANVCPTGGAGGGGC